MASVSRDGLGDADSADLWNPSSATTHRLHAFAAASGSDIGLTPASSAGLGAPFCVTRTSGPSAAKRRTGLRAGASVARSHADDDGF